MTSKRAARGVSKGVPPSSMSAPTVSVGLRSCGCARRFVPTIPPPQHSQSAPVLARRRSRSSTGSSSKSPRSPSRLSSGRNTPSPSPTSSSRLKHKSMSESHLAHLAAHADILNRRVEDAKLDQQPVHFSTTLFIRVNNRQHFMEKVKYEIKYSSGPFQEDVNTPCLSQQFQTELEIQLENSCPVETSSNQT